jgi:hypothetical protein
MHRSWTGARRRTVGLQTRRRGGVEVRGHDQCCAPVEREWRHQHPAMSNRHQFGPARLGLAKQQRDRIAFPRRSELGVRLQRDLRPCRLPRRRPLLRARTVAPGTARLHGRRRLGSHRGSFGCLGHRTLLAMRARHHVLQVKHHSSSSATKPTLPSLAGQARPWTTTAAAALRLVGRRKVRRRSRKSCPSPNSTVQSCPRRARPIIPSG